MNKTKGFYIVIAIFIAFFATAQYQSANAQAAGPPSYEVIQPCSYWNPSVPWRGPYMKSVTLGNCIYIIQFWGRQINGGSVEAQVTNVYRAWPSAACPPPDDMETAKKQVYIFAWEYLMNQVYVQSNWDEKTIAEEAPCWNKKAMITNEGIGIDIDIPLDDIGVEGGIGDLIGTPGIPLFPGGPMPAVFDSINNTYTIKVFEQWKPYCDDSVCCRQHYHVTFTGQGKTIHSDGNIKITSVQHYLPAGAPDRQEPCDDTTNCRIACAQLKWNWAQHAGFSKMNIESSKDGFANNLTITPNPNNGKFVINFDNELSGIYEIRILDLNGNSLFSQQYVKKSQMIEESITLEQISSGIYTLQIVFEDKVQNVRFVVQY